tara:strand:- start:5409 stop:5609 length:201 start_codon:yes stop_codon:yes gene_type:complete
MALVTLGRSDALLVKEVLEAALSGEQIKASPIESEVQDLLDFINIQLKSIAEEDVRSPLSHIWKPM